MSDAFSRKKSVERCQIELSEDLQILKHYGQYAEERPISPECEWSGERFRTEGDLSPVKKKELELLQTLAVCLTTGKEDDVVATTLDKHHSITILLSKNHPPSEGDIANATLFFDTFLSAHNTSTTDVINAIAMYSAENMMKRIRKARDSLSHSEVQLFLEDRIRNHGMGPPEADLIGSLKSLLLILSTLDHTTFTASDPLSINSFIEATTLSTSIHQTELLKYLTSRSNCPPSVAKFHRRLGKLSQYDQGIKHLLTFRDRYGQSISYSWVPFLSKHCVFERKTGDVTAIDTINIAPSAQRVITRVGNLDKDPYGFSQEFYSNFPTREWTSVIHPTYHAELRLLVYAESLDPSYWLEESQLRASPGVSGSYRPIGCSKRSCLSCWMWINLYNQSYHTNWMVADARKRPIYVDWGVPPSTGWDTAQQLLIRIHFRTKGILAGPSVDYEDG